VGAPTGVMSLLRRGRSQHQPQLTTHEAFAGFAARYGHQTSARCETVKFVVDRLDDDRTYFFDSNAYTTHYRFVERFIDPRTDYHLFLRREFTRPDRRFLLGSIMHYLDGGHWTLELSSNDTMDSAMIVGLYERIAERMFDCGLRFRAASPAQEEAALAAGGRLPILSREVINATVQYQPVVLGVAYGRLLFVRGPLDVASVRPYDVVVADEVPNEIPPVAGLVTSQLQAPLAHVAVLCRSRNTPDMAHRGAIDLPALVELEGELVKLTVGGQDFAIQRAERAEAEAAWAAMRPAAMHTPGFDISVSAFQDTAALPPDAARFVGSKAAQLGLLSRIDGLATPSGFVVPFAAYRRHLEAAGLQTHIDALLEDAEFARSPSLRAEHLARVRERISAHPLDALLLAQLVERVRAVQPREWIFRSSSNAEDLAGFSGAGLYESLVVPAQATADQMADALRAVWASVWLQRAFEERDWYRIDHRGVAMAVLVQPCVEDAIASGVAITGNPFQRGQGAFINTQIAGHTVTSATGDELPEQFLVTTWSDEYEFELLNKSSLTDGALILNEADLRRLCDQLFAIHERMLPMAENTANAMDVEFILTRRREFVIVQARPYTIVYNVDRGVRSSTEGPWANFVRRVRRQIARFVPNRLAYRARQ
jgi:rifampicin phosphotransferase